MHGKLTQPKIDGYISWLRRNDHFGMTSCIYDDKSQKLLDELFALLEQVAPESPNGVRTLWLRAERGPIEDFGNVAEEIAEGNYDSEEEFVNAWKSWFPEDVKWYHFQAVEDKAEGYRAVAVRHSYVIVQDKRREPAGWPCEISEFVQWLVDGVRSCIEMLKAGTYKTMLSVKICRPSIEPEQSDAGIFGMSGRMQESTSSRISRLRMLRSSLKGSPHRKKIMLQ